MRNDYKHGSCSYKVVWGVYHAEKTVDFYRSRNYKRIPEGPLRQEHNYTPEGWKIVNNYMEKEETKL